MQVLWENLSGSPKLKIKNKENSSHSCENWRSILHLVLTMNHVNQFSLWESGIDSSQDLRTAPTLIKTSKLMRVWMSGQSYLRPTLDEGLWSNFLRTNLDWFEANWILELDYTLVPSLILGSSNQEQLSF
jgi:hypothetical protein